MIRIVKSACVNCLYFIPHKHVYPLPSDIVYGKCRKFFDVNIDTGNLTYQYAIDCRINIDKCDVGAKHFRKKIDSF